MDKKGITRTAEQVAHRMGVPVRAVYGWIESGRLPAYREGEIWRIRDKDLDAFIAPGGPGPDLEDDEG